jgi:hypothetical protein
MIYKFQKYMYFRKKALYFHDFSCVVGIGTEKVSFTEWNNGLVDIFTTVLEMYESWRPLVLNEKRHGVHPMSEHRLLCSEGLYYCFM